MVPISWNEGSKPRRLWSATNQQRLSIARWCALLEASRQGLYDRPRSLAGKPLAGFRATPDRRIIVLCGMIVSVIWFKNPPLHRQSSLKNDDLGRIGVSVRVSRGVSNKGFALMGETDRQHFDTPFYGLRRKQAWLDRQGRRESRKRVRRADVRHRVVGRLSESPHPQVGGCPTPLTRHGKRGTAAIRRFQHRPGQPTPAGSYPSSSGPQGEDQHAPAPATSSSNGCGGRRSRRRGT